jgi:hypothetical protein
MIILMFVLDRQITYNYRMRISLIYRVAILWIFVAEKNFN